MNHRRTLTVREEIRLLAVLTRGSGCADPVNNAECICGYAIGPLYCPTHRATEYAAFEAGHRAEVAA